MSWNNSILYFTDPHLRESIPINRIDNFIEAQWNKWNEVLNIAKENNSAIICGGDLFNYWDSSHELVNKLLDLLEKNDVYVFTIIGNHDIQGYNISNKSINKSAIGSCFKTKRVHQLDNEQINLFKLNYKNQEFFEDIKIYCENVKYNNSDAFKNELINEADIIISHNYLIPSNIKVPFEHITLDLIQNSSHKRLFLGSHYHQPSHVIKNNNIFLNPGALTRNSIIDNYIPSVVLIEPSKIDKFEYKLIPLKSAKSYKEIFNLNHYNEELANINIEVDLSNITEGNLEDKLIKVAKEKNINQEVLNYILENINRGE